ncbi:MAG: dienelactone hydrolase family protein [Mycobacteriales bacterium]
MGEQVSYPSNGGTGQGYLAVPARGPAGAPAVIVIQEWWGLVPHIVDLADRYAADGFLALAPDLYRGVATREPDEAGKLMMGLAMDQAGRDIAGAADYLRGLGAGPVGAVGFCMGGSLALWSATLTPEVVAAVGFYPGLPWERMSPRWSSYAGKAALIHCAEGDGTSAAEGIQQARAAIEAAGGEVRICDYPGTEHAFFNDTRPEVYHAQAAALSQERTLAFFRERLR